LNLSYGKRQYIENEDNVPTKSHGMHGSYILEKFDNGYIRVNLITYCVPITYIPTDLFYRDIIL
jgi:hypothetical protein